MVDGSAAATSDTLSPMPHFHQGGLEEGFTMAEDDGIFDGEEELIDSGVV